MSEFLQAFGADYFLTPERMVVYSRALVVLIVGVVLARVARRGLVRTLNKRMRPQQITLIARTTYVLLLLLVASAFLNQLGFQLTVVLGAAGVLSVALGFAAQTAVSNIISGYFLFIEEPFQLGHVVEVGGTTGEVIAIDLLSVKLRKFDNTVMRIPNENLMKSPLLNRTQFRIRRVDFPLGVAYKEDTARVREILLGVADANPVVLEEPAPVFFHRGYGDSALELQFSVWTAQENFGAINRGFFEQMKTALDANGIEIPFPHLSFYTGSVTEPLPIRLLSEREDPAPRPRGNTS